VSGRKFKWETKDQEIQAKLEFDTAARIPVFIVVRRISSAGDKHVNTEDVSGYVSDHQQRFHLCKIDVGVYGALLSVDCRFTLA
jgi:hypothetical protein